MWKNLLDKKVLAAVLAAVIAVAYALGATGVVKYSCLVEDALGQEQSEACAGDTEAVE